MNNQDEYISQVSSIDALPEAIRLELPDWCVDDSSFHEYQKVLRAAHELQSADLEWKDDVKGRLDELFDEEHKRSGLWLNGFFLFNSQADRKSNFTRLTAVAAIVTVAVVTTLFLWNSTPVREQQQSLAVKKAPDREVRSKEQTQLQVPSQPETKKVSYEIKTNKVATQLASAVVEEEFVNRGVVATASMAKDMESSAVMLMEPQAFTDHDIDVVTLSTSLASPEFEGIFSLLEPTY
jgi:hypothetical protein